jgi:hypothetical protein
MASSTLFKLKRPFSVSKYGGDIMDKEILDEFRGPFAAAVKQSYERITAGWSAESKPKFVVRAGKSSAGRFFWNIRVEGSELQKNRWQMVDSVGRKGGATIKPKTYFSGDFSDRTSRRGMKLKFKSYYPKTLPRTPSSSSAVRAPTSGPPRVSISAPISAGGQAFYMREVKQGAVEPRRFTELVIEPSATIEFQKARRRAYQRVARRMRSGR